MKKRTINVKNRQSKKNEKDVCEKTKRKWENGLL